MKFIVMCATEQKVFRALVAGAVALALSACSKEEPKPVPKVVVPAPAPAPAPQAVTPPPAPAKPMDPRDDNKDGRLTKAERRDFRQDLEANFRTLDRNNDRGLSREELVASKGMEGIGSIRNNFTAMDTNADGKVTLAERDAWHRANAVTRNK